MGKNTLAHLAVFGANLIYGANYTLAKGPMPDYLKPKGFIVLRVTGALALFWFIRLFQKKFPIERKDFGRLILCGLFGVCLNQILFFEGLFRTSEINSAIMMTSNPIIVLIVAAIIIRERITRQKIIGIVIGAIGAILIIRSGASEGTREASAWGDVLILLNSLSYGIYLVLVKPLMQKYPPVTIISWVFLFGTIFVLVFPYTMSEFNHTNWDMPPAVIGSVLFVIIGTTFFAYLLNIYGLSNLSPAVVSSYIYLQPILATGFALLINYQEKVNDLSWQKLVYALLIFTGVYLVSKPEKRAHSSTSNDPLDSVS